MLKIERKEKIFFLRDNYTFNVLHMMDMKSIVSCLDKLHSGLDLDDATFNK